jgi:hypothetical protein
VLLAQVAEHAAASGVPSADQGGLPENAQVRQQHRAEHPVSLRGGARSQLRPAAHQQLPRQGGSLQSQPGE